MNLSVSFPELFAILPFLIPIIGVLFILVLTALVSVLKKELPLSQKILWIGIILFINMIGPIIYFAIGSKMLDDKIHHRNEGE